MRNVSEKNCGENQNIFCVQWLFENHAICKICGKILYSRTGHRWQYDAYAWHAGYLGYKSQTEYVIIIALPLQQWLHERASIFRYKYIACSVITLLVGKQLGRSVMSNRLRTRAISRKIVGHILNNTYIFHFCIIHDNTLSSLVPILG